MVSGNLVQTARFDTRFFPQSILYLSQESFVTMGESWEYIK